ncbi:hypothetical protein KC332_g11583 [Hortaea werneckii]|nr:hypothetical protein KC350_g10856 [Hortaea werneckii]KAI6844282.1 hypothetical protein KC342_g430 [Hortaea werneckii]KAI6847474.1 hypothetical protein KC358_g2294 [Hortaea werneckii]KAI6900788.1 hypothetical protein KC348_g16712 [Hortaea werneckii]KAI6939850.1 hypothetical protein KC341_g3903 [Hortaea werneckii]
MTAAPNLAQILDTFANHYRVTPRRYGSRNGTTNGYHRSYRESTADSPSRQLWDDFNRMMLDGNKAFTQELDTKSSEQEKLHRQALEEALQRHEKVRQSAERAREQLQIEIELENRRREEEEKRRLEEARRKLAEEETAKQRRELEEAKRREEERKQQEALKREKEEQSRRAEAQKQREEQEKTERKAAQEKEEADRKAREEAAAKAKQQEAQQSKPPPQQAVQPAQPAQPAPSQINQSAGSSAPATQQITSKEAAQGLVSTNEQREAVHQKYLALHKHLKKVRAYVEDECKKRGIKNQLSDMRREVNKIMGQINKHDKRANLAKSKEVRAILDRAATMSDISVDPSEFILRFAKSAISQLIQEAGMETETADGVGVLLVTIFSVPNYRWNGQSLIDVLWAKYHVVCPPLFGITGNQKTVAGRKRLGWWVDGDGDTANAFISDELHYQRMRGLGAGFSALTLRDFSRSANPNPAPNRLWWESLARILNLPPGHPQLTHYVLVKALLADHIPRILQIFASAGKAVIRKATGEFPQKGPRRENGMPFSEVTALDSLPATLASKQGLSL